jgi:hypothetical protein
MAITKLSNSSLKTLNKSDSFLVGNAYYPGPTVADILIVAGGGGGGLQVSYGSSGTGGAGGYRYFTSQTLSASFTVTVGAGSPQHSAGTAGKASDSSCNGQSATGGGQGGGNYPASGSGTGGSGGSGGGANTTAGTGNLGGYTPVEGYAGQASSGIKCGGGSAGTGASGGAGTSNSITGSAVTYAAAGAQTVNANATAGAANTGNGGNSASSSMGGTFNGGAGGSGIVIIAYPNTYPALTSIGGGLTYTQPTRSGYRVYQFTAGTGTVTL